MIDIFGLKPLDLNNIVCHSGGAQGSDTYWETIGEDKTKAWSYKTNYHLSKNKVELSDEDFKEGILEVKKANKFLNRYGISKYMNMLARNWAQVKYSDEVFAIGYIVKVGQKNIKGYYNKGKYDMVDGGTGYAVQMAINNQKPVYIYDQIVDNWFRWSYSSLSFILMKDSPKIKFQNFAGIGTRQITKNGIEAIRKTYNKTFYENKL
jgi:hypothetical protein